MGGTNDRKIAPISGRDRVGAQPLGQRDHGGVDSAEWKVGVGADQRGDVRKISVCVQLADREKASGGVGFRNSASAVEPPREPMRYAASAITSEGTIRSSDTA